MTLKYRTEGFVFKKEERAEADQMLSVFTKEFGRVELKARAIRKIASKLRPGIDIFYFSEVEFIQGRLSKTLTDAVKIKENRSIENDFKKLKIACQIADILDNFIKGQEKDGATFDLLVEVFDKLRDDSFKTKNIQMAFQYFFWNFVSLQGYHLQTQNCACCKGKLNPYDVYFSGKEGGIICGGCAAKRSACPELCQKVNSDAVKVLRLIFKKDWQVISKLKVETNSQKILEDITESAIRAFCPAYC